MNRLQRLVPRSLTSRLVVTAVALVAIVGVLVATSATLAMRSYLTSQLDGKVNDAVRRATGGPASTQGPGGETGFSSGGPSQPGQIFAFKNASTGVKTAFLVKPRGYGADANSTLSSSDTGRLLKIPVDNEIHSLTVGGTRYRVEAVKVTLTNTAGSTINLLVVTGLPAEDIDDTLSSMIRWFALLTLLGVFMAGGTGVLLVRRQLRPLNEVADAAREVTTLDLATGTPSITTRVPDRLTDPTTEVGQVGSALNTLLDHVYEALAERHRSEQQVRQFVADASHELRTPLSTIHGYAELSRRTPDDSGALSVAMTKVETEAGRMSALVEDLLLLARLDSGRPLLSDEVDLTHLLLEAVADARVLAPEHRWHLELPDEPVTATGDADRLHQVVTNLLNNARNHTPPGTTVTVGVADGDSIRITVHDDGPGLPADIADHAFERFTRGDSSRTRESGGAGLGLSLVSAITEAHGGTASVESRPGSTTFTVELPHPAQEPLAAQ